MREIVATIAIFAGVIEALAAIGGPQLAGVGRLTGEAAPPMPTGPLLVGLAVAAVSIVGGILVVLERPARRIGIAMLVASAVGIAVVGPWTGFFTIAATLTILAGVLALIVRPPRGIPSR
jgi:hypothetical protein